MGKAGSGDHSIHELARAKEAGLEAYLQYDAYRRVSLRDHFLPADVGAEDLWTGQYEELGDFATTPYALEHTKNTVILSRSGKVAIDGIVHPVKLKKAAALEPRASIMEIRYDLTNEGSEPLDVMFGVEFAVNLLSGSSFDRYYRSDDRDLGHASSARWGAKRAWLIWLCETTGRRSNAGSVSKIPRGCIGSP